MILRSLEKFMSPEWGRKSITATEDEEEGIKDWVYWAWLTKYVCKTGKPMQWI
jgi:hypothetical protein